MTTFLIFCSSSNSWFSQNPTRPCFFNKRIADSDHEVLGRGYSRKQCHIKFSLFADDSLSYNCKVVTFEIHSLSMCKLKRIRRLLPFASADDNVTLNGSSQPSTSSDAENLTLKFDQSLQGEGYDTGLVQTLHDASRLFELAIKQKSSESKTSWFSTAWLGVDRNSWLKALSYQVHQCYALSYKLTLCFLEL